MEISRHWRLKAQRYRLEGSSCSVCGQPIFPPRPVCRRCSAQTMQLTRWIFPEPLELTNSPKTLNQVIRLESQKE